MVTERVHVNNKLYLFGTFLIIASFIWAYWPIIVDLVTLWRTNEDYSHGFIILPIVTFLMWRKRAKADFEYHVFNSTGLTIVILSLLLTLIGIFSEFRTLANISMIITIWGSFLFLFGLKNFKIYCWELFLLMLMLPIPSRLHAEFTLSLQLFVSIVTSFTLESIGILVIREGNILHIPNMSLEVANACSGLRSIVTIIVLSYIMSCLLLDGLLQRILMILSSIPLAVFTNVIRVTVIAFFAYHGNEELIHGANHTTFGLMLNGLNLILLFLLSRLIIWVFSEK